MTFYLFFDPNAKNAAYKIVTDTNLTTTKWYPTLDQVLSVTFGKYRPLTEGTTFDQFLPLFPCIGKFPQIPTSESHPELFI